MTEETKRPDRSEAINELAAALAKAQGAFEPVLKSRRNPLFHSEYATLDDIISATRKGLSANGLAVMQTTEGNHLVTTLAHSSGQWQSATIAIMVGEIRNREGQAVLTSAQAYGSAITYARRYSLAALLCVAADEDDDGNAAGDAKPRKAEARAAQEATTAPKPPGAAQTTQQGEKAAVEGRGNCPVHNIPFVHRKGIAKTGQNAGKPYDFWGCQEKNEDGTYCQEKPAKVEPKTEPLPLADAPRDPADPDGLFDKGNPDPVTAEQRKAIRELCIKLGRAWPKLLDKTAADAQAIIDQWTAEASKV